MHTVNSRLMTIVIASCYLAITPLARAQAVSDVPQKATPKPVKGVKKITPVSQIATLPDLTPEQLALADRVSLGKMPCELATFVNVKPDPVGPGRFLLELGYQNAAQKVSKKFSMVPVVSLTGALRLEDQSAGAVWIQLGNKSMLMDQKAGHRLADACVSADQAIVAKALERNPVPGLLDAPAALQAANSQGTDADAKELAGAVPAPK